MSEEINNRKVFSLYEVTRSIQNTLSKRYSTTFWVKAEMNKLNHYQHSGHCYPELVEKKQGKVIAEMRSILWRDDYERINRSFISVLKEPLKNGINILFSAKVNYDPVYGLSLTINDIDPSFTLGELEREKQETVDKLRTEGIYDQNRCLLLPILPKRIAIISVESSKGYSDFIKVIDGNPWGYHFFHMLFPALLQGEKAIPSIRLQLQRIRKVIHHFDAVAIIRGGGGDVGLSCYNNYFLAKDIATFPIPVITGIGHSTNETVSEMIAFKNAITPTELADFLIQKFHNYAVPVQKARERITDMARRLVTDEKTSLVNVVRFFKSVTGNSLNHSDHLIQKNIQKIKHDAGSLITSARRSNKDVAKSLIDSLQRYFKNENTRLESINKNIELTDPVNVLKRGYSITYKNGKLVKDVGKLLKGDEIETILYKGKVISTINKTTG